MKKGLTPVISTIMMVLIAIGIVGLFYGWANGLFSAQIEKSVSIPSGSATCDNGLVTVRAQNIGATSSITTSDITVAQIAGRDCTVNPSLSITPGQSGVVVAAQGCGTACATGTLCSGNIKVRVGTKNGVVESSAFCA